MAEYNSLGYGGYQTGQPEEFSSIMNLNQPPPGVDFPGGQPLPPYPGAQTLSPYDDSPSSATQIGGGLNAAGDVTMAAGAIPGPQQPFIAGAGLALKGAGTLASIYGSYKDREEAKKRYQDQLRIYESRERERKSDKALEAQRRERQEGYFSSEFSQGLEDRLSSAYGGYRTGGQ